MIEGHCLCGAVTVTVVEHGGFTGACHCRMCQRWSGALFVSFNAAAADVTVRGEVARFASTDFAERAFCPKCGSHLWMRNTDRVDAPYDLMPGLFDAARDIQLKSEIYTDRALPGLALAGDHRRATRAEYEAKNLHIEGDAP
ncbi:GFA family protein [Frigidibacter sp. RF13]|uniref:GFA family protein n=1 Tax=Frigidibacter sp. RF13 TaxID=2997340 RepID=UPI00226E3C29|nr:GFA family protein [Frigidibacter sp. RF13]MCY1126666.1 GFA family protein [Frigidibacter sp. RF13]